MRAAILIAPSLLSRRWSRCRPSAEGARYAVIIQGASGDPQYATHASSLGGCPGDACSADRFGIDAGQPDPADRRAEDDRRAARNGRERATAFGRLAKETKADDLVFVMLIGHGSGTRPPRSSTWSDRT